MGATFIRHAAAAALTAAPVIGAVAMRPQSAASDYAPEWWMVLAVLAVSALGLAVVGLMSDAQTRRTVAVTAAATIAGAACYEAVVGLCQLGGLTASGHSLFPMTGTFYNPGPFGGYLAMGLPVGLSLYLGGGRMMRAVGLAVMLLIVIVLPATASRSGWLAGAAACALVAVCHRRETVTAWLRRWWLPLSVAIVAAVAGAYMMKSDSADGRLLMWKIGLQACAAHPGGVGWHGVAGAYGAAQEAYFASGDGTAGEIAVTGSPEYMFNDYIQVALAWGLLAAVVFVGLLTTAVVAALKTRCYGLAGALTAFMVFAFSSYPLQFPLFVTSTAVLIIGVSSAMKCRWATVTVALAVATFAGCESAAHRSAAVAYAEWQRVRYFYGAGHYEAAAGKMEPMRDAMDWNPRFVFELGHSLSRAGRFAESNDVLQSGLRVCGDAMLLNVIGNNYRSLGMRDSALTAYRRASYRMPNRMYPYYLMVKLAAEGEVCDSVLLREASQKVLGMPVKVMSPAVREMRDSTRLMLRARGLELRGF